MKRFAAFIIGLSLCGCGLTPALMVASTGLLAVDMMQTRTIAKNPDKWHENNPILGKHPSEGAVYGYFGGIMAANIAAYYLLPKKVQPWWYGFLTVVEIGMITNNLLVGIGF